MNARAGRFPHHFIFHKAAVGKALLVYQSSSGFCQSRKGTIFYFFFPSVRMRDTGLYKRHGLKRDL